MFVSQPLLYILDEINSGNARESVALQIRGESQRAQRIVNALRVVGIDVPHAASKAEGYVQQQGWTEGVGVVDGKQVRVGPPGTALSRDR